MCGIILIFVQSIFRMTVRSALETDLGQIMAVLDAAKGIMRADGNDRQWVGGYPSEAVISERMIPSVILKTRSSSAGSSGLLSMFIRT